MYSITSRQSFDEILVFQQQILRVKDKDYFPIIVVGNKCDLEGERQVSKQGLFSRFLPAFLPSQPIYYCFGHEIWVDSGVHLDCN